MAAPAGFAAQVHALVRSGLCADMPFYETLPELNLVFGKNHTPSLQYGANYFLQLSKVNDLNRMSTDMVNLYTHDLTAPETDLEKVYEEHGIESIKAYGKSIRADAIVADLSARNKLFKKERTFVKSNNYLKENNFYVSDYSMMTFEVFRPLFDLGSERFCIVKLPTLFGRTVANAVRVYCSLFRRVQLRKGASDSWLKDSALLVCRDAYTPNLERFLAYVRASTRSPAWREANNAPFTLLDAPVEREFLEQFLGFSNQVYMAIYYVHTLLYNSMTSESKSIENDFQRRLVRLLRS